MQPELGTLATPPESGAFAQCGHVKNLDAKKVIHGANSRMPSGPVDTSTMFPCRELDT
jgi:hypothetical protein